MIQIQELLSRLENVSQSDSNQWMARCPSHEDRKSSLAVGIGDNGGIVLHCHASCPNEEVVTALGLKMSDLSPAKRLNGQANASKPSRVKKSFATWELAAGQYSFDPKLECRREDQRWFYHDPSGKTVGVILRWNLRDGSKEIRPVALIGGAWTLSGMPEPRPLFALPQVITATDVVVCEGEKSASKLQPLLPPGFVATTSPHGAKSADKADWTPLSGKRVFLWPDNDDAGKLYIKTTARCCEQISPEPVVSVLEVPNLPPGGDAVDFIELGGTCETLQRFIESAQSWESYNFFASFFDGDESEVTHANLASTSPKNGAVQAGAKIVIDTIEHRTNDAAVDALANEPSVFQRGGVLVHVVRESALGEGVSDLAPPRIAQVPLALLRDRLTAVAQFVKVQEKKEGWEEIPCHPPDWCVAAVAARGNWPKIRSLRGLVTAPVLKPDGTILATPGYDVASGLLYESDGQSYSIPQSPSLNDAKKAVDSINQLVADFPFAKPEHRSAFLGALLTPLARFAFDGPAPLFLFDANVRGSGKSLLADLISWVVTKRPMPRMPNSDNDDEMRKRIMALALGGDQLVLLDNISSTLGCPSLDAALTGTTWKDRILGKSEVTELPLSAVWFASGNNVMLAADTSRRVLHVRLDSPHERPELRDGFAVADIRKHVREHRADYLSAALTISRAYFVAGCPKASLSSWGSFEGWSDLIRQAIVWCGEPDPGLTREEFIESADTEHNCLRELIRGWDEMDADCVGVTTTTILEHLAKYPDRCVAVREAILELCPAPAGRLPSSKSLGRKLRGLSGRVVDGRFIDSRKDRNKSLVWRVRHAEAKSTCEARQFEFPEDDARGLRVQQNSNPAPNPAGQSIEW